MNYKEKAEKYIEVVKKQMESIGVLEEIDIQNLEFLRTQVALYYRALDDIEENGFTSKDKQGRTSTNPAFNVQRSAMANITALLRELSVSARQRRFLTRDEIINEEDPMDAFLAKMQKEI